MRKASHYNFTRCILHEYSPLLQATFSGPRAGKDVFRPVVTFRFPSLYKCCMQLYAAVCNVFFPKSQYLWCELLFNEEEKTDWELKMYSAYCKHVKQQLCSRQVCEITWILYEARQRLVTVQRYNKLLDFCGKTTEQFYLCVFMVMPEHPWKTK